MRRLTSVFALVAIGLATAANSRAEETDAPSEAVTEEALREAISKSIPLLEKGALGSAEQRKCFTCHSQAMPVLALSEAKKRGFAVDQSNFERQLKHTAAHLKRGREKYLEGRGQGGQVITAGYALWALEAGGHADDETTAAVTHYLLEYQKDRNRWSHGGNRPPSSGSDFMTTYVALRGLTQFGTEEQEENIQARTEKVGQWITSQTPRDTEDRVFRLWSLPYLSDSDGQFQEATKDLLARQQEDGGWAQMDKMESDAYATGTVLVAMLDAGAVTPDHEAVRRGVRYLLRTQLDDGSWHVVTRAKPFQTYFESGFPHGKDQFISITASSWSTLALLQILPRDVATKEDVIPTAVED